MKRIAGLLFSARLMAVIIAVFAVCIGLATFIENDFGSLAARSLIYNSLWFEILLLAGAINLTGRVIVKKLYSLKKLTIFLFHIAFIIILAGAAITRYWGSEGTMRIREGETANTILSDRTFIQVKADKKYNFVVSFNPFGRNHLNKEILHQGDPVKIKSVDFVSNAFEGIAQEEGGSNVAEFIFADSAGRRSVAIQEGEIRQAGQLKLNFSDRTDSTSVVLLTIGDSLFFITSYPVAVSTMGGDAYKLLEADKTHKFRPQQLYSFNGQILVLNEFFSHGKIIAQQIPVSQGQTYDAVVVEISSGTFLKQIVLTGKSGYPGESRRVTISGKDIILNYGSIYNEVPFKLKLNDFIIERYPGSQSPSSFESRVLLMDTLRNYTIPYRIYMNNILKYRGYRFYQSSYDADEKGTILAVNHDRVGTSVTYSGYIVLSLCMILSLINRNSRFRVISADNKRLKYLKKRIVLTVAFLMLTLLPVLSQPGIKYEIIPIDNNHAAKFARLLVQDNSGRVEPAGTLSSEVIRKLLRKNSYNGMNSDQVFLGMLTNPSVWQYEHLIRASHPEILDILGTKEKYHAFATFFTNQRYILQEYVAGAFRKKPAVRTKFDNEIIKLDERINICYLVFTGELLRIFPLPADSTHTWYSSEGIRDKIFTADSIFTRNVLQLYTTEVQNGQKTGNWAPAEDILEAIYSYQKRFSEEILPSEKKVSFEILLTKWDIFSIISKYYGLIGFVLLLIQIVSLFYTRIKLKIPLLICLILIGLAFLIHTFGLGIRWYVSGHAPLSNGYEALIYVAWAAVLAGLLLFSKSSLTLSIGSILGFLTLFVAHLSWMDPQITNLVPVLKSYWLVIHVAIITASYGFLAMGALLAYINLLMMAVNRPENRLHIKFTILEITNTIEMTLTIGLYLLTIGVFLGAVWANESWGRYWGWDPKETWALVTVLVYAFVLHMRMVPGLRGIYAFNLTSLLGFSSVLMTYFGVNYYLSGLHSYAKGDPLPIPAFVYYTLIIIALTALAAMIRNSKLALDENNAAKEEPQ